MFPLVFLSLCVRCGHSSPIWFEDVLIVGLYRAVHINSMTIHDEPALPHGGVKNSGWGRFNTSQGLEEFLVTKSVTWMD